MYHFGILVAGVFICSVSCVNQKEKDSGEYVILFSGIGLIIAMIIR